MALTDNLVSYWNLDEASGNALDPAGSNTLTDTNTVTQVTGTPVGNARLFTTANNEYFVRADNASLSVLDIDFTWVAWFRQDSFVTFRFVFAKGDGSNDEYSMYVDPTSQRPAFVVVDPTTAGHVIEWPAGISLGSWYMAVGRHDSVNNTLSININASGTPASTAYALGVRDGGADFMIGNYGTASGSGNQWDGAIAKTGFWKRILTPAEETQLYNGGAGMSYAAILAASGTSTTITSSAFSQVVMVPTRRR